VNSQRRLRTENGTVLWRSVAFFSVGPFSFATTTFFVTFQHVCTLGRFKCDPPFPNGWFEGSSNSLYVLLHTLKIGIGIARNTGEKFQRQWWGERRFWNAFFWSDIGTICWKNVPLHIVHSHIVQKKMGRNLAKTSLRPNKCNFGYRWKVQYIRAKQTWMSDE
jgi:hypothetical protein